MILSSQRCATRVHLRRFFRPHVEWLEPRLPLGDALLSQLLPWSWWGQASPFAASASAAPTRSLLSIQQPVMPNRPAVLEASAGLFAAPVSLAQSGQMPPPLATAGRGEADDLSAVVLTLPEDGISGPGTQGVGTLHGHGRFERIRWDPSFGHVELYEYKAFLTPEGDGRGYSYHMGDPGTCPEPYTGCFVFRNVPAGSYTLMTSWGEFFPRGAIVSGIVINGGETTQQNVEQPLDYSGYLTRQQWDPSGASSIFQTFVAAGTSITRVAFAKADGSSTGSIRVSLHADNGGPVETWPQVGPTRTVRRQGANTDHWVAWNAGEVATTPWTNYAVRLRADNGVSIQPYWSNDDFYPYGTGYRNNQGGMADHDYHIAVFSDSDGTINTLSVRSHGYNNLVGWWGKWAQSYLAQGTSFAGSTLQATVGGGAGWNFTVRVQVHAGSPDGPQIGPTKTMPVAFAPFAGVAGAAFAVGEVPTIPGETYWVVYDRPTGEGFNTYRMNEGDTYAGGTAAYFDGSWHQQPFDLMMSLYEYAGDSVPPENLLTNSSFEQSSGRDHPGWVNNSSFSTNGRFPDPGIARDGQRWASFSYGVGGYSEQELYQTLTVEPGRPYRLASSYFMGGTNGVAAASLRWADGDYPGLGSGSVLASATWTHPEDNTGWQDFSAVVTPTGKTLTIILRAEVQGWGGGINVDAARVTAAA